MSDALLELDIADASLSRLRAILTAATVARPAPAPTATSPSPEPAPPASGGLQKPTAFYALVRASDAIFGGKLTPEQFAGCEADLQLGAGRLPLSWMAYCLATDYHETGHTMQPIHEAGSRAYLDKYDTGRLAAALGNTPEDDDDGVLFAGRGKPQVTGHRNYAKANQRLHELGILKPAEDLLAKPDLMLRMDVASAALVIGMLEGWYTGKTLNTYLPNPATRQHFANARRIINGADKADLIAGYAMAFQDALRAGAWA